MGKVIAIEGKNLDSLKNAYESLLEIIANLYEAGETALESENNDDASLLFAQADKLYITAENLSAVITEQEE